MSPAPSSCAPDSANNKMRRPSMTRFHPADIHQWSVMPKWPSTDIHQRSVNARYLLASFDHRLASQCRGYAGGFSPWAVQTKLPPPDTSTKEESTPAIPITNQASRLSLLPASPRDAVDTYRLTIDTPEYQSRKYQNGNTPSEGEKE